MCIAIYQDSSIKGSKKIPYSHFKESFENNNDSVGIMYKNPQKNNMVIVRRELRKLKTIYHEYLKAYKLRTEIAIHFRIATSGGVNLDNCHPFTFTDVNDKRGALIHNGVIPIEIEDKRYCDTYHFTRLFDKQKINKEMVQSIVKPVPLNGSKIILFTPEQTIFINKEAGVEENGVWYSNTSYKKREKYVWEDHYLTRYNDDKRVILSDGYDIDGFDKNGFNKEGYDKYGYNEDGYNREGFYCDEVEEYGYADDDYGRYGNLSIYKNDVRCISKTAMMIETIAGEKYYNTPVAVYSKIYDTHQVFDSKNKRFFTVYNTWENNHKYRDSTSLKQLTGVEIYKPESTDIRVKDLHSITIDGNTTYCWGTEFPDIYIRTQDKELINTSGNKNLIIKKLKGSRE